MARRGDTRLVHDRQRLSRVVCDSRNLGKVAEAGITPASFMPADVVLKFLKVTTSESTLFSPAPVETPSGLDRSPGHSCGQLRRDWTPRTGSCPRTSNGSRAFSSFSVNERAGLVFLGRSTWWASTPPRFELARHYVHGARGF